MPEHPERRPISAPDDVLLAILAETANWPRFLEMSYFAREPDLLVLLRELSKLPEASRAGLISFLQSREDGAITIERRSGRLILQTFADRMMEASRQPGPGIRPLVRKVRSEAQERRRRSPRWRHPSGSDVSDT
jgi:hypothetical protein